MFFFEKILSYFTKSAHIYCKNVCSVHQPVNYYCIRKLMLPWCCLQKHSSRSVLNKRCFEKMQQNYNFIEIILWHWCSPVNLLHIFTTSFPKDTSGWPLLLFFKKFRTNTNTHVNTKVFQIQYDWVYLNQLKILIPCILI